MNNQVILNLADTPIKRAGWVIGFLVITLGTLALFGVVVGLFGLAVIGTLTAMFSGIALMAMIVTWIIEGDPKFWRF